MIPGPIIFYQISPQVDRTVGVAGLRELTSFNHLFWVRTRRDLTDNHIWFSVWHRPPRSHFSRVQRLTCCLCLLFTAMMCSILFYQQGGTPTRVRVLQSLGHHQPKHLWRRSATCTRNWWWQVVVV